MSDINVPSDPMEAMIYRALKASDTPFTNDPRKTAGLDFLILEASVHIEVKQFHSDRIAGQMARADNVIAVQGREAVAWLSGLIEDRAADRTAPKTQALGR